MSVEDQPAAVNDPYDEYEPKINEVFSSILTSKKYIVEQILGKGACGTVVRCCDSNKKKSSVAIKIVNKSCMESASDELDTLLEIKLNLENKFLIEIVDAFYRKGYFCMALEVMDMSLENYLCNLPKDKYLDLAEIRRVSYHVLMGLVKLKELGIVHGDLKPDNIMLNGCGNLSTLRAKIIDFSLSHRTSKQPDEPYLQSAPYRSPEIFMYCLPYSEAIDVWSAGCILGELLTKVTLFYGKCEYDIVRYIIEMQGSPPEQMIRQGLRSGMFFIEDKDTFQLRLKTPNEFLATIEEDCFGDVTMDLVMYDRFQINELITTVIDTPDGVDDYDRYNASLEDRQVALDLLENMLKLDPNERIDVKDAVQHAFFDKELTKEMVTES